MGSPEYSTQTPIMKRKPLVSFLPFRLALIVAPLIAAWPQRAYAASGTWNVDAAGNWGTAGSWSPSAVPGTVAGDVINLTFDISAARTVTINTTSRRAGDLNIGDPAATLFAYTLASSATSVVLNLDGTDSADATVDFQADVANTISAPLTLVDNGVIRSNVPKVMTLSGVISGAGKTLTFNNDTDGTINDPTALWGQFLVTGANTYSGGTTIDDVRVNITTNNTALGAAGGNVDIQDGGQVFASTNLGNINYAFNIAGDGWVETTAGQPLGALRLEGGPTITGTVNLAADAAIGGNGAGTISGVISGGGVLSKRGTGTTTLSGANTYSGGTIIKNGAIQLNNGSAAGSGEITFATGGATNMTKLLVNGGVTASNNVTIPGGTFGVAGQGVLQQTGTGLATLTGNINITGGPTAGGLLVGGNAATNALVLTGVITSSVPLSQRDGVVRYSGGGAGYTDMVATGTVQVGAPDGISTVAKVHVGGSGNCTLDLNGFPQRLASVSLGNGGTNSPITGTIALGTQTLSLDGDLSTRNTGTGNAIHRVTAGGGGTIDFGASTRSIAVNDSNAPDDLVISGATLAAAGLTKDGAGALALDGARVTAPLSVNDGALQIGTTTTVGSATLNSVNFAPATTLRMKAGPTSDSLTVTSPGGFVNSGITTLQIQQPGGILANGTYPLINYSGATPGTASFNLVAGHATASLVDSGGVISLQVTGNDRVIWDGTNSGDWFAGVSGNWKKQTGLAATDYIESDDVIFADTPTNPFVTIVSDVTPSQVSFTNTAATSYVFTGAAIKGGTNVAKTGDGLVTLQNTNTYTGSTLVSAGTLELDHDAPDNVVLTGTSDVTLAPTGTLALTRDDGGFTFNRPLAGNGTVEINAHSASAGTAAHAVTLSGANTGFNGTLILRSPQSGTYRLGAPTNTNLGSASIVVESGAQQFQSGGTYTNPITITGTGYRDVTGTLDSFIGALRIDNTNWAGPVSVSGSGRIGAHNSTGTVSGSITGGDVEVNVSNHNNPYTVIFTGTNGYGTTTIGGGNTGTAGPPSYRLNIGANGTTGTLGIGNVTINGDGANGVLGFDRADGYTLRAGQSITGAGSNILRTFIDLDCQGAGFSDNGNTITLGGASMLTGGQFRAGQARVNAVTNLTGSLTAGRFGNAVANNSTVNINSGAQINVGYFTTGEAANSSGTVNQATGSTVNVTEQLRLGHFGTETSTYNMNGGDLTLTGDSPSLSPSTAAAGGAGTTGDNNINATNPTTIVGGGIYLGIDGTGIFNQNAGTVSTNWIVLDNRGDNGAGANMPDGIDRYNLNAGTLNIRSTWGMIARNTSTAVSLGSGTIRVDNNGNGTGTGANLTIPLDANITVTGASTLDTNGAGNAFTLSRSVLGSGSLALTGGGKVNINSANPVVVSPAISGAAELVKLGAGTASLTGSGTGFTGPVTLTGGRLDLAAGMTPAGITQATGTTLSGEVAATADITLNGGTLVFDPNTPGALSTTGALNATGVTTLDLSAAPAVAGPWTALTFGSTTAIAANFSVANPASFRTAPTVVVNPTSVTLDILQGKGLVWTGAISNAWDINNAVNWVDTVPAAEKFFNADIAVFPEGGANPGITLTGTLMPLGVVVNSDTTNYSFGSSAGNLLSGPTGITKSGASTLSLSGTNAHSGLTSISGGAISIAAPASLGNGAATNGLALSGGGQLIATAAANLGSRNVAIGTGGGGFVMTNAAAQAVTVGGNVTGSEPLSFSSTAAGGGNFVLAGINSGYTGAISVGSTGAGISTLTLSTQSAVPSSPAINVNFAPSGANASSTNLALSGVTLPAGTTLNFTSNTSGSNASLRSGITSTGSSVVNGPVVVEGSAIVQINTTGSLALNGPISAGGGGFSGANAVFFIRGSGTGVINGTVNLPNGAFSKTDNATWTINSTGNVWASTNVLSGGSVRLGANNALAVGAPLSIGQGSDAAASLLDLNGFNQEVNGLTWIAGNANSARGVGNTSTTPATLTLNSSTDYTFGSSTGITGGSITGPVSLVKNGINTQTLAGPANTYTGNVVINDGTLIAGGAATSTALGSPTAAGRSITVNAPGQLVMSTNNVFGNGVGNANLPTLAINGTTVDSTRYNTLGPVLMNGGTLSQSATDVGAYEGYQFKGPVTVAGTVLSTMITGNGKANHLDANTLFTVADVTPGADLIVATPLRNQSGDFGGAAGGLTKAGAGTMELAAGVTSTYTGATFVNAGTLQVEGTLASSPVTVNAGGTLGGNGTVGVAAAVASGGTLAPGASVGTLNFGSTLDLNADSTYAVEITGAATSDKIVVTGALTAAGKVVVTLSGYVPVAGDIFDIADAGSTTGATSFDFTAAPLTAGLIWDTTAFGADGTIRVTTPGADPFTDWATSFGLTGGKGGDDDGDGVSNLLEFATNADPKSAGSGARTYPAMKVFGADNALTFTIATRKNAVFAASGVTQTATRDKVIYTVEASNDLANWTTVVVTELNATDSAAVQATLTLPALGADWEWHTFRTDAGAPADATDMVRLKVAAAP